MQVPEVGSTGGLAQGGRRALPVRLACALAVAFVALLAAGQADAKPVIAGFSITAVHNSPNPNCEYEWCFRFTFRAWEPDQFRDEKLRWRLLVLRAGDDRLVGNFNGRFPNDTQVQRWWAWPTYNLNSGQYIARLVINSARGKRTKDRFFRVSA